MKPTRVIMAAGMRSRYGGLKQIDPMDPLVNKNTLSGHGSVSRGICETAEQDLASVVERLNIAGNAEGVIPYSDGDCAVDMTGEEICSMNFWGFTPRFFKALEKRSASFLTEEGTAMKSEWLIPPSIDDMINSGETRAKVLSTPDAWFGATYPDDKPIVVAERLAMHDGIQYPPKLGA